MNKKEKSTQIKLDSEDLKIEKGTLGPAEGFLYPREVLDALELVFKNKRFDRPRGKKSPTFSIDEIRAIIGFILFKPKHIVLKVYERIPREKEPTIKRRLFLDYFFGDARYNGAKAARMAGYSPRSAKQIAYKIKQS